jgi:hypothetical protein
MKEETKNINYTAADIEKYYKGELSPEQMNAMEKAALDDPFLADAMEGYASANTNVAADIEALKNRLAQRTGAKVVEMNSRRKMFAAWKVAAMIIFILGAGFLIYQLGFNTGTNEIAVSKSPEQKTSATIGESTADTANPANAGTVTKPGDVAVNKANASTAKDNTTYFNQTDPVDTPLIDSKPVTTEKLASTVGSTKNQEVTGIADRDGKVKEFKNDAGEPEALMAEGVAKKKALSRNATGMISTNVFRGQVLDANNNPLPFANITNTRDEIGTYTDARGSFVLTSPDSVLNVKVRSFGFSTTNNVLRNNVKENEIVLQEQPDQLKADVIGRRLNSTQSRLAMRAVEEPEPADGWENYDTYIINNLTLPGALIQDRDRSTAGEVELSFEVDKNGKPINIKIEKSLCKECDAEAIRLIKEGPKWKRKKKNARAKVAVPF